MDKMSIGKEILGQFQNDHKKIKVAVAMSGGVDSSVAAMLLKKQGYEVVGFMMKLWYDPSCKIDGRENACCDEKSVNDARQVADKLGIPFYLVDAREEFKKEVVDYFIEEYKALRTPNPCVKCNQKIKFGWLLDFAKKAGCEFLATGHYARIVSNSGNSKTKTLNSKLFYLLKGIDEKKDQSYFLYNLTQEQLAHVIFPVGEYTKDEIRKMAKEADLPVHEKVESQEICFIQENDYREFLKRHISKDYFKEGDIVDSHGYLIGHHLGLINYTIGQRKGVNQEYRIMNQGEEKKPLYVIGFDLQKNQLIVGEEAELYKSEAEVDNASLIQDQELNIENQEKLKVKIRYRAKETKCSISLIDDARCLVRFFEPQRAVTPGQSAVFYKGEEVVGGGIIA